MKTKPRSRQNPLRSANHTLSGRTSLLRPDKGVPPTPRDCRLLNASLVFVIFIVSLQALFCSSLPHPTADKDYALYEVGTGCEVAELIPGIDLLSESFRSNGRSVVAALRWITEELARARYLISVGEY